MDLRPAQKSERELVESYIEEFAIEGVIDEILNTLCETRPPNPYTEMAKLIESKTKPEIISLVISSILAEGARSGVEAKVVTNLGEFSASCGDPFIAAKETDIIRNFALVQENIKRNIIHFEPTQQNEIDAALSTIADLEPCIICAVSKAIARAGARHQGMNLYSYIASLAKCTEQIPLPVPTVLSAQVGEGLGAAISQDISLFPIASTFLDSSMESLLQAHSKILGLVNEKTQPK